MEHILWCTGHDLKIKNANKAQGCFVYDQDGNCYLDLESGVWVTPLGHSNPRVNQAISDQVDKIIHCGYYNGSKIVDDAARELLKLTGIKNGKGVFLSSGSEAVEFGIKAIHKATGKNKLLRLHDSFLGSYGAAGEREKEAWHLLDWTDCQVCPEKKRCALDCPVLEDIPYSELGGFVFEPGSAGGLVKFPPQPFIDNLVSLFRKNGGLILVNEVTTGIGRSGKWFGFQYYDFQPDLVAMGKGLGNGYPVSATVMNGEVAKKLEEKGFYYQQSHQNDPLGCRVVLEVIDIINEENLVNRSWEKGEYLRERLKDIFSRVDFVKEIRGRGLMIALEFDGPGNREAAYLHRELFNKGFIVSLRPGHNALRIDPPLNIEVKHLDSFLQELDEILELYQD